MNIHYDASIFAPLLDPFLREANEKATYDNNDTHLSGSALLLAGLVLVVWLVL